MSNYVARQYQSTLLLVLVFGLATATSVLIKNPEEILGTKGAALLALGITSTAIAVGNKKIAVAAKKVSYTLSKRTFREREILKFYGIKSLTISNDIVSAELTSSKKLGFAILKVDPYPFPFQNLPEKTKERYCDGWLRTIQGIDFRCSLKVSNRAFDASGFKISVEKMASRCDSEDGRNRISRIVKEVNGIAKNSYEKTFSIVVPSSEKEDRIPDELRGRVNTISSLLRVNLGLDSRRLSGNELIKEVRSAITIANRQ